MPLLLRKFICFAMIILPSCANLPTAKNAKNKPPLLEEEITNPNAIKIVVSIPPQKYLIKRIGGDRVRVVSLLSESDNFLTATELSEAQQAQLADAQLFFKIGAPFEEKLKLPATCKEFSMLKNVKLKPFSASTNYLNGNKSFHHDPYIWLSPATAVKMLSEVYQGLREIDGENYQEYTQNFTRLTRDLNSLEGDIQRILMTAPNNDIYVSPPVLGYYCADFGLKQFTYNFDGGNPNDFVRTAIENKIRVVLFAQFMPANLDARVAELINGVVATINPLAENYPENLMNIANLIAGKRTADN